MVLLGKLPGNRWVCALAAFGRAVPLMSLEGRQLGSGKEWLDKEKEGSRLPGPLFFS